MTATFEDLIAEGAAEPVQGWDFSWFEGRATEQRPSWGYSRLLGQRMSLADAGLDLQTGGGEVLAGIPRAPRLLVATEAWPPNVPVARRALRPLGGSVVRVAEVAALPFADASFDLVVSRHPTTTPWAEIARILRPGGTFLSQGVAAGSNHELSAAMLGPFPVDRGGDIGRRAAAEAVGLVVADLRHETVRAVFHDIGAVVYFLRKVLWTVPGFTVEGFRPQLAALHERIRAEGSFVSHAQRYLVEATKPE